MEPIAPAVSACGHLPPSSWSDPTVTSQPGITLAARTGAMQHNLCNTQPLPQNYVFIHMHTHNCCAHKISNTSGLASEYHGNDNRLQELLLLPEYSQTHTHTHMHACINMHTSTQITHPLSLSLSLPLPPSFLSN